MISQGLQTFYGPCALSEFAEFPTPDKFTTDHFFQVLGEENQGDSFEPRALPRSSIFAPDFLPFFYQKYGEKEMIRKMEPSSQWSWIRSGKATGKVMGGCILVLLRLAGIPYWPSHKGYILFLKTATGENIESPFPLARMRPCLADLRNIGVFDEICGLIIGRSYQYDEAIREELAKVVLDQVEDWDFPILMNVDIGHTSPMLTIPLNVMVSLDSNLDEFSILESAVVQVCHYRCTTS